MNKTTLTALLILTFVTANANAASYQFDYTSTTTLITANDGSRTEWLHLNQTRGKSYDFVSSNLDDGGLYEGWHYATMSQVNDVAKELFGFNWETEATGWNVAYDGITTQLVSVFGSTKLYTSDITYDIIHGYVSDYGGGPGLVKTLKANDSTLEQYLGMDNIDRPTWWTDGSGGSQIGSFLVRAASPVPLPSAAWLLGSGLAGLATLRRKK